MHIHHDIEQQRFVIDCSEPSGLAILDYRLAEENTVDFYRTFVPPELRNKGLAEKLVKQGLKWAKNQDFTIKASCWYVQKFLKR